MTKIRQRFRASKESKGLEQKQWVAWQQRGEGTQYQSPVWGWTQRRGGGEGRAAQIQIISSENSPFLLPKSSEHSFHQPSFSPLFLLPLPSPLLILKIHTPTHTCFALLLRFFKIILHSYWFNCFHLFCVWGWGTGTVASV